MTEVATQKYEAGSYEAKHGSWHSEHGPGKAVDIWPGMLDAINEAVDSEVSVLEVGCGTGTILNSLRSLAVNDAPKTRLRLVGIDIAEYPLALGRKLFPKLELRQGNFLALEEKFDVVLFCDVLEHVENPFEFLRHAGAIARTMVVRQPLQGDFGIFRRHEYPDQIEDLGHIQYFNERSFRAIAAKSGWEASKVQLVAPWELTTKDGPRRAWKAALTKLNRPLTSFLLSGFYLNGSFRRRPTD